MKRILTLTPILLLVLAACSENPVDDGHDGPLTVVLERSSAHVHTLSEVEFSVTATNDNGAVVEDVELLTVDYLRAGTDTWRSIDMVHSSGMFKGTYMFTTSGEYQIRVSAQRTGEAEASVIHQEPEALSVGRAHEEVGGVRVEYESSPGHIHSGEEATLNFWITEAEKDASGNRPAITNVQAEIVCHEPDGSQERHSAAEAEPGRYTAMHHFATAGQMQASIVFTGTDGVPVQATFAAPVAHGH